MSTNIAKLLATCLCITTVTAWDLPHEAQIRSLSNQIDNLKSLLNQPNSPVNRYNYGHEVSWDNNINRNTDYERYLKQRYILPILDSLKDISEQIVSISKANAHKQRIDVPFSMNFYPPNPNFGDISDKSTPFNAPFGSVGGWGVPSYAQSQSGSSSYSGNTLSDIPSAAGGFSSYTPISSQSHSFITGDSSGPLSYDSHRLGVAKPDIPNSRFPDISNRYPADYDPGQNWGLVPETETDSDNKQPIPLKPTPKTPQECNCEEQNKNVTSLALQLKLKNTETNPTTCKAVILLCCVPGNTEQQRKECFTAQGCPRSYSTGIACLPVVIQAVYKDLYENL